MSSFIEFSMVLQRCKRWQWTLPKWLWLHKLGQLIKLTVFLLIHLFNVDHIMSTYEKGAALNDFLWDQLNHPMKIYDLRLICPDYSWLVFSLSRRLTLLLFSVQFSSVAQSCPTLWDPWIAACQASLSITNTRSSPRLTSIESVMPSSHLILCHPLLLLPPIPPSIRVFSNESTLHIRGPKYWSFSFSIIPSKEIPGLISFRMDWLDLLAVQGTLKSLLQMYLFSGTCICVFVFLPFFLSVYVSIYCCSVAQSCPTLCDSMGCSTPGFPVLHYLLEFAQTHIHWVGDAIQPSHPVICFSSCFQSFPASGSFPKSHLFTSGG